MRVRISEMNPPLYFQDAMIAGPFRSFVHDHSFEPTGSGIVMYDRITFFSPVPLLGEILDLLVVCKHLERFISERNLQLKAAAESNQWRHYLSSQAP
jgi:ligand-binding SRPBCC domain-containing protein